MSDQVNVTYWGFRCENASAAPPFRRHFRRVIDVLTAEGSDRFAAELIFGELVGNVGIGERLHIGLGTVKSHIRDILEKLSANDRTQAAVNAMRRGYL